MSFDKLPSQVIPWINPIIDIKIIPIYNINLIKSLILQKKSVFLHYNEWIDNNYYNVKYQEYSKTDCTIYAENTID